MLRTFWLPELDLFETTERRRAALRRSFKSVYSKVPFWLFVGAVLIGVVNLRLAIQAYGVLSFPIDALVAGLVAGVLGGLGTRWLFGNTLRNSLRQQLIQEGLSVCLCCGYDLHGQPELRCPECGTPFDRLPSQTNDSEP